ncbi:hypothetical protein FOBRF1_009726 [Fusarium oxysporum]
MHSQNGYFNQQRTCDRYLSSSVKEWVAVSPNGSSVLDESYSWDLRRKAYHITRVAATFNTFATYGDATSLFQRLKTIRLVRLNWKFSKMGKQFDKKEKLFSVLPRILEEWLRHDRYPWHTFEVVSSLTSIIASDISVLDEILEDQGIIELNPENNDANGTKKASEGRSECVSAQEVVMRPSEEDQGEPLVLRGSEFALQVANQDTSMYYDDPSV